MVELRARDAVSMAKREVSLDELEIEARNLWQSSVPGSVIWLEGELGSGKTTFVKQIVAAASASGATSPTFSLVHTYDSPEGPLHHADCYRIRTPDEAVDMDLDTLALTGRMLLIEWPSRAGRHAPDPHSVVFFEHGDSPSTRLIEVNRCVSP